jgi:hypothetical protein
MAALVSTKDLRAIVAKLTVDHRDDHHDGASDAALDVDA